MKESAQNIEAGTKENSRGRPQGFAATQRTDPWWFEPLWTGFGFFCFVIYATWAAFQGQYYWHDPYLSPFYSPLLFVEPHAAGSAPLHHAWMGAWPSWWPSFLPASPALLILAGPLSFRLTCYYYRKFYYRSYFATPAACAVNPLPRKNYKGETGFLLFQNIHRYTLYIALFYIFVLSLDAFRAFFRDGHPGVGVGTIVLCLNVFFLSSYTLGCHAFRHLMGGRLDCFSCCSGKEKLNYKAWEGISKLNSHHMLWAWISMIWVGFSDLYVKMVAMGIWRDWRIL